MKTYWAIIDRRQPFGSGRGNHAYTDKEYADRVLYRALRRFIPEGWEDLASAYFAVAPVSVPK